MILVQKKQGKIVTAYQLGTQHPVINKLMQEKKIISLPDGQFEVMSQEAVHGKGEIAQTGDFIKLDADGWPYPNTQTFFQNNHRHLSGAEYEQIPQPLEAWTADEDLCEEVFFLIKNRGLVLNADDPAHYFTAPLWGTLESAARDAVLVFYSIQRDETGRITDADFNFVARNIFDQDYDILSRL